MHLRQPALVSEGYYYELVAPTGAAGNGIRTERILVPLTPEEDLWVAQIEADDSLSPERRGEELNKWFGRAALRARDPDLYRDEVTSVALVEVTHFDVPRAHTGSHLPCEQQGVSYIYVQEPSAVSPPGFVSRSD